MTLDELTKAIAGARERDAPWRGSLFGDPHSDFDHALADRRALLAVIDQLLPDARRYQFIRSEEANTEPRYYKFWNAMEPKLVRTEKMDALVDSWISRFKASDCIFCGKGSTCACGESDSAIDRAIEGER